MDRWLDAAMKAANVTSERGTLNAQAKSAARSAFESAKQRFFSHLITSMKTATLIKAIERDLHDGHAAVIQIVSTGEALMERRLAEIPTEEWGDVQVDITPRKYVLDYLRNSSHCCTLMPLLPCRALAWRSISGAPVARML